MYDVAGIETQDIQPGSGDPVTDDDLVVMRYVIRAADGTTIDDTNLKQRAVFRPGAHQVLPGIEDAVIGMKPKGERRIRASSERIYSSITESYDIGERSVVAKGTTLYVEMFLDAVNPYGK